MDFNRKNSWLGFFLTESKQLFPKAGYSDERMRDPKLQAG
jgi:hypothetical protein